DRRHNLSLGSYYSHGDYGMDADTSIYYFPLSYDYTLERWRFKITVPHIQIAGPGNVLVNVGSLGRGGEFFDDSDRVSADGTGDTLLSATYQFDPLSARAPFIDVTVEIKVPTADEEKGLGTGETDYGIQLDLYQMAGQTTLFSTMGYRKRGRSTLFPDMKDSYYVSLGMMRPFSQAQTQRVPGQFSYGVIYDFRQAAAGQAQE